MVDAVFRQDVGHGRKEGIGFSEATRKTLAFRSRADVASITRPR